jgi:hypothetical protein
MAQGFRDMLANRRFAIPLIILLAFCFIGLLLIGVILIWQPGAPEDETPVAGVTSTATLTPTDSVPATSVALTDTPTPRPSPTLVPVGTAVDSAAALTATAAAAAGGEGEATATVTATTGAAATAEATSDQGGAAEETPVPGSEDDQLAQTGVGWGLILASAVGLAALVVAARRLRLAS